MKNTQKMMSLVTLSMLSLFLVLAVPSFAQRVGGFTIPRMPTIPRTPSVPRIPSVPRSTPSVQIPRSAPQTTPRVQQTQPRPAQSAPQRSTASTPQSRPETTPSRPQPTPREQASSRKEVEKQQKAQARQQKEGQKQKQQQQKEQARQQKEQKKQQQKQQKEEARHQKELQKQQKNSTKATTSTKETKSTAASHSAAEGRGGVADKSSAVAPAGGSKARLQQLNSNRSNMSGINRKPLPSGELTVHPNGRMTLNAEGGRQYGLRSNGTVASYSDRQKTVSFDKGGKVSSIHTSNMDVHNGPHGSRTIISRRADGSKLVSTGRHSGYVERSVVVNNRTYIQRTAVINQRVYTRTFIANGFGRVALVPPAFFAPGFYGWAYYPWAAPVHFAWGWFGAPWYVGPYFAAAPVYPSAAFWLTDYMIGETLSAAYQLHHDGAADLMTDDMADEMSADDNTVADATDAADSDGNANVSADQETLRADAATPITPELKYEIAEEVKQQLANDNAEALNPGQASFDVLPAALSAPNHVFVVSSDLDVTTTDQQLCNLQAGDMLQLTSPAATDSSFVQLRVASSKRMDCPGGVLVNVSLPDLQEMQNSFQAHIEAGLGALRGSQGRDGLPSAPPAALAAPPQPVVSGLTPVSGPESSTLLDQEREQADQAQAKAELGSF